MFLSASGTLPGPRKLGLTAGNLRQGYTEEIKGVSRLNNVYRLGARGFGRVGPENEFCQLRCLYTCFLKGLKAKRE